MAVQARDDPQLKLMIPHLVQYLHTKGNNWFLLRACIGLVRNLAFSFDNLALLCQYRSVHKVGKLFVQMTSKTERHELFLIALFVLTRQSDENLRTIIFDEIIQSGCIELIALVKTTAENIVCHSPAHTLHTFTVRCNHESRPNEAHGNKYLGRFASQRSK
jgi:hypothetical protein